jgi:Ethanolamine utilization protein EutJ (predicted chaperonin)
MRLFKKLGYVWAALTKPKPPDVQESPSGFASAPTIPAQTLPVPKTAALEKQLQHPKKLSDVRRPRRYERTLVVGVDFGTSSTKVVWQDLNESYFELFRWRSDTKGIESALLPSTISVRAGMLVFGNSAPDDSDIWIPSIKLCILCSRNASVCRCRGSMAKHGQIQLAGDQVPVPAAALASLFLAYVFQHVEAHLKQTFPNDELVFVWNVGCPMDHLDAADSKSSWERMAGTAMRLRGRVSNPAEMALLAEASEMFNNFVPSPDSNVLIQPEGMAAVKAFLESARGPEEKTYAIVDVGAGTTEVSFFFNGGMKPSYLADSTEAVGGGKFDIELAERWRCDVETARRRKEQGAEEIPEVPSVAAIRRQYDRTCRMILQNRRLIARSNKRFDLFVIGGGGRLPILRDSLTACRLPGDFMWEKTRRLVPPANLRNASDVQAHYDLLANACGLASSLDWQYYPTHEVLPLPPPPMRPRPDRDDLYAK